MNNLFIFDGDDTLWDTQPMYAEAEERFADVAESLGFARDMVKEYNTKLDMEFIMRHGLGRKYLGNVMAVCLRNLIHARGEKMPAGMARKVIDIGNTVYNETPKVIEGAWNCLSACREYGYIHILTAGHPVVQYEKYKRTGTAHYADGFLAVDRKTPEEFAHLMALYDTTPGYTWMIGNSIRSDIIPASKADVNLMWVKRDTWVFDEHSIEDLKKPLHTVNNMYEARVHLLMLMKSKAKVSRESMAV